MDMGMSDELVDLVTCGPCQKQFPLADILTFIRHKRFDCEDGNLPGFSQKILLCQSCPQKFKTPWSLLQHAQRVHSLQIYLEQGLYRDGIQGIHIKTAVSTLPYAKMTPSVSPSFQGAGNNNRNDVTSVQKSGTTNSDFHQKLPNISTLLLPTNSMENREQFSLQKDLDLLVSKSQSNTSPPLLNEADVSVYNPSSFANQRSVTNSVQQLRVDSCNQQDVSTEDSAAAESNIIDTLLQNADDQDIAQVSDGDPRNSDDTENLEQCLDSCDCKNNPTDIGDTLCKVSGCLKIGSCCSNQDCGITVMPGTHEKPKKCCNAVIPKKRKRHMVTTHLTRHGRRRFLKNGVQGNDTVEKTFQDEDSSGIFIDFEHSSADDIVEAFQMPSQFESLQGELEIKQTHQQKQNYDTFSMTTAVQFDKDQYKVGNTKSVIIQPGSTFSIPIPHSQNSSPPSTIVVSSISNEVNVSDKVTTVTSTVSSEDNQSSQMSQKLSDSAIVSPQIDEEGVVVSDKNEQNGTAPEGELVSENADVASFEESVERKSSLSSMNKAHGRKRRYPTSRPYKCNQCDLAFNQRIHLKKHQSKHTGIKPYKCEQCDYSTVERSHLKVHIRVHTGEKPFKCTYCEYATAQNSTLKIHLKRHHGSNVLDCRLCGKYFPNQEVLAVHMKDDHNAVTSSQDSTDQTHPSSTDGTSDQWEESASNMSNNDVHKKV